MKGSRVAVVGGGNMGGALIGGLVRSGWDPAWVLVIDPSETKRSSLEAAYGIRSAAVPDAKLKDYTVFVWAVKPQEFAAAASAYQGLTSHSLHVSVMAGIKTEAVKALTGSDRIVRAMPNSPALIGEGIAGVFARPEVDEHERVHAEALLSCTSTVVWFETEDALDAVTAISGSGPAYVFYLMEAMLQAAQEMGFSLEQAQKLVQGTVLGSARLAIQSRFSPEELRAQVTSKGGTTHAALQVMEARGVKASCVEALHAACERATELGRGGAGS